MALHTSVIHGNSSLMFFRACFFIGYFVVLGLYCGQIRLRFCSGKTQLRACMVPSVVLERKDEVQSVWIRNWQAVIAA